ncbi:hypothetical protein HMSSN036_43090 [Paenibacillus macerans]|nr:hypothetical protein HMSSN036_43090 [Paenibacillus macerans]
MLRQTQDRLGWSVSLILFVLVLYPLLAVFIQVLLPGVFFGNWERGDLSLLLEIFRRPLWQKSLEIRSFSPAERPFWLRCSAGDWRWSAPAGSSRPPGCWTPPSGFC